jgi:hypothetical protein
MPFIAAVLMLLMSAVPAERAAVVVNAADTPVRLDRATILTAAEGPPVLYYAATNLTSDEFEVFTVTAFIFDAEGTLKARQTAPARRTLLARETKYSTLILDGSPVTATDVVVVGVNQAQRAGTETWWRGELQDAAKAAAAAAARPPKK